MVFGLFVWTGFVEIIMCFVIRTNKRHGSSYVNFIKKDGLCLMKVLPLPFLGLKYLVFGSPTIAMQNALRGVRGMRGISATI